MNILVVKTGALGDVVRCTFIAQALKDKYKKSKLKLFWLTDKKAKPLFINNPYVDNIFVQENKDKLKKFSFDLIVNLEESKELTDFVISLNPKELIGFYSKNGEVLPTLTIKEWYDMSALGKKPKNNELKKKNKKTHRQIMSEVIGVDYKKYEPFLRLTKWQRNFANHFLRRHQLNRKDLIIGINTGAADRWPKSLSLKKTADLIDKLYKEFNATILLFGGPNEIKRNREIISLANSPVIDTGCGNNLIEFPALISLCSLFITSDTLGLHIALALKRKTLVLIGPTSVSEIDLYGLGEKIVSKSKCICCYKQDCKSMEKININEIIKKTPELLKKKITILITAFNEPNVEKTIKSLLNQKTDYSYEILVSAPDKETLDIAKKYQKNHKNINTFKDPGKGKSYALNLIFKKLDTDLIILTDGDVYLSENALDEILNLFLKPEIGCVTGRPTPMEDMSSKYGYWAHFLFDAAHRIRKQAFIKNKFIECSGYLFAFRKKFINEIPLDVAEDTIIPYYFWQRGYSIGYAENARVFVKNVDNREDWLKQKIRTAKAHETLNKYVDTKTTPKVKSFLTEIKGTRWLFGYPRNLKEFFWTSQLAINRLFMWLNVNIDTNFKKSHYQDAWQRIESTK
jgi:ADP-heptose:LPS heptosyltransferase